MRTKRYEGKTPDEIRELLTSGEMSRSTHYRIRKETGINDGTKDPRVREGYEVSKGPWV